MDRIDQALAMLWAKKNDRDGRLTWLPLTTHLEDTKGVITCLYQHWMSDGQKEILLHTIKPAVGTVDEALGRRLAQFLASVHDIGKATPVFQTQKSFQHAADLDDALVEHLEQSGFTGISELSLDARDRKRTHHTVTGEYLLGQYGVRDDIASIIGAHHGKPLDDKKEVNDQRAYETFYDQGGREILRSSPFGKRYKKKSSCGPCGLEGSPNPIAPRMSPFCQRFQSLDR